MFIQIHVPLRQSTMLEHYYNSTWTYWVMYFECLKTKAWRSFFVSGKSRVLFTVRTLWRLGVTWVTVIISVGTIEILRPFLWLCWLVLIQLLIWYVLIELYRNAVQIQYNKNTIFFVFVNFMNKKIFWKFSKFGKYTVTVAIEGRIPKYMELKMGYPLKWCTPELGILYSKDIF